MTRCFWNSALRMGRCNAVWTIIISSRDWIGRTESLDSNLLFAAATTIAPVGESMQNYRDYGDSDSGARRLERCRLIPKTNLEDPKDLKEPRVKGALAAPEAIPQLRCEIHSWRGHRGQAHMGDGCDRETWESHRTLQAPGQLLLRACPRRLRQEWQPKPVSDVPSIGLLSNPPIFVVLEIFEVPKAFA